MAFRASKVGTTTATTTVAALYTQALADTPGLVELTLDAESDAVYSFDSTMTAANGTRIYAGQQIAIPVMCGARCYVITASGTAVVRWALNYK